MKHLSTTLTLLFLLTAAVHAADLEVCGSSISKTGYISSSAIKSGTIYYDASTKMLTLRDADIYNNSDATIVNNGIEGLAIHFVGTCTLSSPKQCIFVKKYTIITGNTSSTVSLTTRGTSDTMSALYAYNAELAIKGQWPQITAIASSARAVFGGYLDNSKLTLEGAWLKAIGTKGSIDGFWKGITFGNQNKGESIIASPHHLNANLNPSYMICAKGDVIAAADMVRIVPKSSYYGVRIKGEALTEYTTSSDVTWSGSYNTSTKTLKVYEIDATNTYYDDPYGVLCEDEGITVQAMKSGAFIKSNKECLVFEHSGDINVPSSYSLSLTSSADKPAMFIKEGTVTLSGGGKLNTLGYINGFNSTLNNFKNVQTPMSIQANDSPILAKSTFEGVMVKTPSDVELAYNGMIQYKNSNQLYYGSITVGLSEKYPLSVNGIDVDESNCYRMGPLFGTTNYATGYSIPENAATYSPSSKTLTLNSISVKGLQEGISSSVEGLTVKVIGSNWLELSGSGTGMNLSGTTTIKGDESSSSKLIFKNCKNGIDLKGVTLNIRNIEDFTINNCTGFGIGSSTIYRGRLYAYDSNVSVNAKDYVIGNLYSLKGYYCGLDDSNLSFSDNYLRRDGTIVKNEEINICPYYATVKVGNTTMTESNFDDLAYGVSFDYMQHRIELMNANISGTYGVDADCPRLLVDMWGTNTINATNCGILLRNDNNKIYGHGGTLNITAGDTGISMLGSDRNPVVIENCDITLNAQRYGLWAVNSFGICLLKNINMTSESSTAAMGGFTSYEFEDCHIAEPSTYSYNKNDGRYMYMTGNLPATRVVVKRGTIPTMVDAIVEETTAPEEIYDLQGRRMQNAQAGNIYLVRRGGKVKKLIWSKP